KKEGSEALKKVRQSMQAGVPPGDHILDGITILIAGIVLFIPGFFTDVIGFILLIPFTRKPFRNLLNYMLIKKIFKQTDINIIIYTSVIYRCNCIYLINPVY